MEWSSAQEKHLGWQRSVGIQQSRAQWPAYSSLWTASMVAYLDCDVPAAFSPLSTSNAHASNQHNLIFCFYYYWISSSTLFALQGRGGTPTRSLACCPASFSAHHQLALLFHPKLSCIVRMILVTKEIGTTAGIDHRGSHTGQLERKYFPREALGRRRATSASSQATTSYFHTCRPRNYSGQPLPAHETLEAA